MVAIGGLIGGLVICGLTSAVAAEPQQVVVQYRDLDLSQPKDVALLYQRINSAAGRVCIAVDGKRAQEKQRFNHCKFIAVNNAVVQVAVPALSNFHSARVSATTKLRMAARD
jgi:UrcA family protein